MKKVKALFAAVKRSPKLSILFAAFASAVIVPAALYAWGPDRPTFTIQNPASYVTFNSIVDNPAYGDERNFVRIKEATAPDSTYSDNIALQGGKEYMVYVYYHNNASSSLNQSGAGVAQNANLRMEMPAVVKAGQSGDINGYISASNANPGTVYDETTVTASTDTALRFVPGSATINNFGSTNGQVLPDSLMTNGTPLGFNALNGVLPGCNEFAGYVLFKVRAEVPNFDITKNVSLSGAGQYSNSVNVTSGTKVDYKVQYRNVGDVQQNNVIIKDTLPAGMTYVPGSTFISNSTTNSQWSKVDSDELVKGGINIGDYAPNGNAYVKYSAVANGPCGTNTLVNTVSANTNNGSKSASANVIVTGVCQPGQTPPTVLPETGIADGLMTLFGLGGLTAATAYAVRSQKIRNLLRR